MKSNLKRAPSVMGPWTRSRDELTVTAVDTSGLVRVTLRRLTPGTGNNWGWRVETRDQDAPAGQDWRTVGFNARLDTFEHAKAQALRRAFDEIQRVNVWWASPD